MRSWPQSPRSAKNIRMTFAFSLEEISSGTSSLTKKDYYPTVSALIQHKAKKKLSVAQMETLAIIAYKQPITKSEIEHIRGVSCDYAIQKLLEKELVAISGKSEGPADRSCTPRATVSWITSASSR